MFHFIPPEKSLPILTFNARKMLNAYLGYHRFIQFVSLRYKNILPMYNKDRGFPGGAVVESLPANVGDMGLSPGPGRSHMPQSN